MFYTYHLRINRRDKTAVTGVSAYFWTKMFPIIQHFTGVPLDSITTDDYKCSPSSTRTNRQVHLIGQMLEEGCLFLNFIAGPNGVPYYLQTFHLIRKVVFPLFKQEV